MHASEIEPPRLILYLCQSSDQSWADLVIYLVVSKTLTLFKYIPPLETSISSPT
jgi:hypothetical protein